jgi:dTDP-4-amino-4,6-dideoxygalactose transaminase
LSKLPLFEGECPNGSKAFNNSIALPMFYELKEKEIEYIVNFLHQILNDI